MKNETRTQFLRVIEIVERGNVGYANSYFDGRLTGYSHHVSGGANYYGNQELLKTALASLRLKSEENDGKLQIMLDSYSVIDVKVDTTYEVIGQTEGRSASEN